MQVKKNLVLPRYDLQSDGLQVSGKEYEREGKHGQLRSINIQGVTGRGGSYEIICMKGYCKLKNGI